MVTKKSDSNLRSQIKVMEAAKRAEILSSKPIHFVKPEGKEGKVSYDEWWMIANKKVKQMKPWMKEIVLADFKGRGLTISETMDKYDQALGLFGYKI